ncbi:MAG: hypothetical protein KC657_13085 [Myxococcales bacterium]|nr:hypothetical protein [Myxococcales bacterium]
MTPRNRLRSVLSGACLVAGCAATVHDPSARREGRDARPAPTAVAPARGLDASALLAVLPDGASPFAPALTRVAPEPAQGRGAKVADVEGCAECHADVALQWGRSAHAFASFDNPVYRTVVDGFRHDRGEEKSQFCGGCHDPALLLDGAMRAEIKPADARARAGVSCRVCHGVTHARADGNGSYDLDLGATVVPRDGEPESRLRHRATVARATLRTAEMCATCHKAFLDPSTGNAAHLVGQDDATPWARSAFAGSHGARIDDDVERRRCQDCHMPAVDVVLGDAGAKRGKVRSHEFLGGHTWLAAMLGDRQLTARAASFLKGRVSLDVAAVRVGGARTLLGTDPAAVREDDAVVLDLVMRNLDVGHAFPGGVRDAQDTWLEVVVTDASGIPYAGPLVGHLLKGRARTGQPSQAGEPFSFSAPPYEISGVEAGDYTLLPSCPSPRELGWSSIEEHAVASLQPGETRVVRLVLLSL